MLAAKAAIATRVDALGEETNTDLGIEHRAKVESRIRQLEGGAVAQISGSAKKSAKFDKYENTADVVEYKAAADVTIKRKIGNDENEEEQPKAKKIKVEDVVSKSEKKKKKKDKSMDETVEEVMDTSDIRFEEKKKKKKKEKTVQEDGNASIDTTADASLIEESGEKKKKKKKKKDADE